MSTPIAKKVRLACGILALVAVVVIGNWLYWVGDGRPGSPADFRDRVEETGLVVEWVTNGPRAGEGTVTTDCGVRTISISSSIDDDSLWLLWIDRRIRLTSTSAEAFQACTPDGE